LAEKDKVIFVQLSVGITIQVSKNLHHLLSVPPEAQFLNTKCEVAKRDLPFASPVEFAENAGDLPVLADALLVQGSDSPHELRVHS
jgi:hypothetical protein